MSFSFGFGGDDIDDEVGEQRDDVVTEAVAKCSISEVEEHPRARIQPQKHSLNELLSSLPSQISYNSLQIPSSRSFGEREGLNTSFSNSVRVYRRSLFDIRAQLMAEADPARQDELDQLLSGLENGDVSAGIYEGGFKTWECAVDLASLVTQLDLNHNWRIIELGAGSAVPSLALLRRLLSQSTPQTHRMHFVVCDYNEEVLRLCSAPNMLLNHTKSDSRGRSECDDEGEFVIEDMGETLVDAAVKAMRASQLSFDFVSGPWGDDFLNSQASLPATPSTDLLILASETIYSPDSTKIFVDTILRLLRDHAQGTAKAWVAAKKVYFGVGGGVDDFVNQVRSRGGSTRSLFETKDTGVVRVVLEVTV